MENRYAFRAYNTQTQFGYGTEQEAAEYADRLNRYRNVNTFAPHVLTPDAAVALNLGDSDLGFSLEIALSDSQED